MIQEKLIEIKKAVKENNFIITNIQNGYQCDCVNGFMDTNPLPGGGTVGTRIVNGDISCTVDIDECADNPCHANATCTNTVGGYTCSCNDGYTGNGTTCTAHREANEDCHDNHPQVQ